MQLHMVEKKAIVFITFWPKLFVQPWYGAGRDICNDNYFTSYTLANQFLQQNLTLLGTVRQLRSKVPQVLRQKDKLYKSKFVSNHGNRICLVDYQTKEKNNQ